MIPKDLTIRNAGLTGYFSNISVTHSTILISNLGLSAIGVYTPNVSRAVLFKMRRMMMIHWPHFRINPYFFLLIFGQTRSFQLQAVFEKFDCQSAYRCI